MLIANPTTRSRAMNEATLTADISVIKSQLETEIIKYQSEIYLRQAKIHALDVLATAIPFKIGFKKEPSIRWCYSH